MSRENGRMNYPWYCDACEEEWFDSDSGVWFCSFDDVLSSLAVLETNIVYPEKES